MTAGTELAQRRRNVRCLELLDDSYRAHTRGLARATQRLGDTAYALAPETCGTVLAGMQIGEVPHPGDDPHGWADYLQAQRDALAQLEQETVL